MKKKRLEVDETKKCLELDETKKGLELDETKKKAWSWMNETKKRRLGVGSGNAVPVHKRAGHGQR